MSVEEDKYIVRKLIANDAEAFEDFLFNCCRAALTYIGQYFCQSKETAESLIGEFYERGFGISISNSSSHIKRWAGSYQSYIYS